MTGAPHPTSIAFPSSRAPDQDGNVLTSLGRASSRLYSRSGLASAPSNKLAIVLPIDTIFAPPLQDRPRRSVRDPQIPIGRVLRSPSSPRFPPCEAFGRRPRRLASTVAKDRRPKPFSASHVAAACGQQNQLSRRAEGRDVHRRWRRWRHSNRSQTSIDRTLEMLRGSSVSSFTQSIGGSLRLSSLKALLWEHRRGAP